MWFFSVYLLLNHGSSIPINWQIGFLLLLEFGHGHCMFDVSVNVVYYVHEWAAKLFENLPNTLQEGVVQMVNDMIELVSCWAMTWCSSNRYINSVRNVCECLIFAVGHKHTHEIGGVLHGISSMSSHCAAHSQRKLY